MSEWIVSYPINFTPGGDKTNAAIEKIKNELTNQVYPKMNRIRIMDAGDEPPDDPMTNSFWMDTSTIAETGFATLKRYNGTEWSDDVAISSALTAAYAASAGVADNALALQTFVPSVLSANDGIPVAGATGKLHHGWLPIATTLLPGIVKIGSGLSITEAGVLSADLPSGTAPNYNTWTSKSFRTTHTASTNGFLFVAFGYGTVKISGRDVLASGYVDFCSKHEYDLYVFPIKQGDTYYASGSIQRAMAFVTSS